jgi:hypothetical protein
MPANEAKALRIAFEAYHHDPAHASITIVAKFAAFEQGWKDGASAHQAELLRHVRANEREACAVLCDAGTIGTSDAFANACRECAATIRALASPS